MARVHRIFLALKDKTLDNLSFYFALVNLDESCYGKLLDGFKCGDSGILLATLDDLEQLMEDASERTFAYQNKGK